jgi:hypothetical protein
VLQELHATRPPSGQVAREAPGGQGAGIAAGGIDNQAAHMRGSKKNGRPAPGVYAVLHPQQQLLDQRRTRLRPEQLQRLLAAESDLRAAVPPHPAGGGRPRRRPARSVPADRGGGIGRARRPRRDRADRSALRGRRGCSGRRPARKWTTPRAAGAADTLHGTLADGSRRRGSRNASASRVRRDHSRDRDPRPGDRTGATHQQRRHLQRVASGADHRVAR